MEGGEIMASERVAAVTGAASGIGRATALALGRQGARVALCDRNAAGLAEVEKTIQEDGGRARVVELDVSDQAQAARAIDGVAKDWGLHAQVEVRVENQHGTSPQTARRRTAGQGGDRSA